MSQTLRRELRKRFEEILTSHTFTHNWTKENQARFSEKLTDAALEVSGVARSQKFSDPNWDILHGKIPEDTKLAERIEACDRIAQRLSAGLRRGEFPQSTDAQKIYAWIFEREQSGQSLDRFISWAMEGRRAEFSFIYHKDPGLIKRDWLQVHTESAVIAKPESDGGFR